MKSTEHEGGRNLALDCLHVYALCGFAFAQPIYDLLGHNAEFFVAHRTTPGQIIGLVLLLSLGIPTALVGLELLVGFAGRRARRCVHTLIVFTLVAFVSLPALKSAGLTARWDDLLAAIGVATVITCLYRLWAPGRMFVSVVSPAFLIFPALFLLASDVKELAFPSASVAQMASEAGPTDKSLVMLVLDELPVTTLMNTDLEIDANRFPNFARLASESIWFRNAQTISTATTIAVPAILSGRFPADEDSLPIHADHSENLFTVLGPSFERVVAMEAVTALMPPTSNEVEPSRRGAAWSVLVRDLSMVCRHLFLPSHMTAQLPPITQSWQGFGQDEVEEERPSWDIEALLRGLDKKQRFRAFTAAIDPEQGHALYFLHSVLPHVSWKYLPSGRKYAENPSRVLGLDIERELWSDNEWAVRQGYQRHVLQTMYLDTLLGELLAKLEATGLYDTAVIVVLADHGVSFRPNKTRRGTPGTLGDLWDVPLFIRRPGVDPVVIDSVVHTTDVLTIIARAFDIPMQVEEQDFERVMSPEELLVIKRAAVRRLAGWTGPSSEPHDFVRVGTRRDLVGTEASALEADLEARLIVELLHPEFYVDVRPQSEFVPAEVIGYVRAVGDANPDQELAIAVNGTIQAITRTLPFEGGMFAAIVPEDSFVAGENLIELFTVEGPGESPELIRVRTEPIER